MTTASDQPTLPHSVEAPGPAAAPHEESNIVAELGLIGRWIVRTFIELPRALRFPTEVTRQLANLVLSSSMILWLVSLTAGFLVAKFAFYLVEQIGATAYIGLATGIASITALLTILFGFMVAGKVACGFVAELGSMRINEEIDALEVMGIPSRQYLVGTRVLAAIIAIPLVYIAGVGLCFIAARVASIDMFNAVSPGGYNYVFWSVVTPMVLVKSIALVWSLGAFSVIVGCYYGFNVRGGPVEVGDATARSMMVNVVAITMLGSGITFQLLFGTTLEIPIAN
ncbi:MAG: ABC transporter permease [Pseudonocardiaceae bacterium]|nr:ABC transporter permease [Pseudonocardiaceae bacterium]